MHRHPQGQIHVAGILRLQSNEAEKDGDEKRRRQQPSHQYTPGGGAEKHLREAFVGPAE